MKKVLLWFLFICLVVALAANGIRSQSTAPSITMDQPSNEHRELIFFTEGTDKTTLQHIQSSENDDSFETIRQHLNTGVLKVSVEDQRYRLVSNSEVAYPVSVVEHDETVQAAAQKALWNGQKVYLYGTKITPDLYKQLLNINSLTVTSGVTVTPETPVQIIGFTSDTSVTNPLYMASIQSSELQTYMYLRSIMDDQINSLHRVETGSGVHTNHYVYGNHTQKLIAMESVDWSVLKDLSEKDSQNDRYSLQDHVEVTYTNGGASEYFEIDHSAGSVSEQIENWQVNEQSEGLSVKPSGSQLRDSSQWEVGPTLWQTVLPNPLSVTPETVWVTSGSNVAWTIRHQGRYFEWLTDTDYDYSDTTYKIEF